MKKIIIVATVATLAGCANPQPRTLDYSHVSIIPSDEARAILTTKRDK